MKDKTAENFNLSSKIWEVNSNTSGNPDKDAIDVKDVKEFIRRVLDEGLKTAYEKQEKMLKMGVEGCDFITAPEFIEIIRRNAGAELTDDNQKQ